MFHVKNYILQYNNDNNKQASSPLCNRMLNHTQTGSIDVTEQVLGFAVAPPSFFSFSSPPAWAATRPAVRRGPYPAAPLAFFFWRQKKLDDISPYRYISHNDIYHITIWRLT